MSRAAALVAAVCVAALVLATPAAAALEVRLTVTPSAPYALEPTKISLRTFLPLVREDGSCCRLVVGGPASYPFRVEAVSAAGSVVRVTVGKSGKHRWSGTVTFPRPGRWDIRVANYPRCSRAWGARSCLSVRVAPARPTPAPAGLGPLGRPGCAPPSPVDASATFRDVFGTALGGEVLWALPFLPKGASWSRPDAAAFDGLVGKEVKIVFGMTMFHAPFDAIGPDGQVIEPVWGPKVHGGSNWIRQPGHEWGAGFVFPKPGCWRIRVGSRGDVWMLVRS